MLSVIGKILPMFIIEKWMSQNMTADTAILEIPQPFGNKPLRFGVNIWMLSDGSWLVHSKREDLERKKAKLEAKIQKLDEIIADLKE